MARHPIAPRRRRRRAPAATVGPGPEPEPGPGLGLRPGPAGLPQAPRPCRRRPWAPGRSSPARLSLASSCERARRLARQVRPPPRPRPSAPQCAPRGHRPASRRENARCSACAPRARMTRRIAGRAIACAPGRPGAARACRRPAPGSPACDRRGGARSAVRRRCSPARKCRRAGRVRGAPAFRGWRRPESARPGCPDRTP